LGSTVTLDMDTVKLIAEAAARAAVEQMSEQHRRELEIQLKSHFGETSAAQHIIQHERLDKLLGFLDSLGTSIFATLIRNMVMSLIVIGTVGWVIWTKLFGG
jgi:hypothetical protein